MADDMGNINNVIHHRCEEALFIPLRIKKLKEYHERKQQLYQTYGQERIDNILDHSSYAEGVEGLQALKEELEYLDSRKLSRNQLKSD
jgi:hypothetical protein